MEQVPFGFPGAEPGAAPAPVDVKMEFVESSALDDVWIAYLTLPYKDIFEFEGFKATPIGKVLGCVAETWLNFTNEWPCFVMRGDHRHVVWQQDESIYRCCLGMYKYLDGSDDGEDFAMALDRVMKDVPLITRLAIEQRDIKA